MTMNCIVLNKYLQLGSVYLTVVVLLGPVVQMGSVVPKTKNSSKNIGVKLISFKLEKGGCKVCHPYPIFRFTTQQT